MWYVYIIKSDFKKWYYIGSTNDIKRRLSEHNDGKSQATKYYRPLTLVFSQEFASEPEARQYEKRLKLKRKEKEEIIKSVEKEA